MATSKKPPPPTDTPANVSGNDWDFAAGPSVPDLPAGETMPRRAVKLASQNGKAMRTVFAYLLDDDDDDSAADPPPPSPPPPPPKAGKK